MFDVVEAMYKACKSNISDKFLMQVVKRDFSKLYRKTTWKTIKIPKRPGEPDRSLADISKLENI